MLDDQLLSTAERMTIAYTMVAQKLAPDLATALETLARDLAAVLAVPSVGTVTHAVVDLVETGAPVARDLAELAPAVERVFRWAHDELHELVDGIWHPAVLPATEGADHGEAA